ncbi:MAG: hypothetical protein U0452_09280 [Anaerolineae bacterium]
MGLNERLAEQIDFSSPGTLREKLTAEGSKRSIGISTMVATFVGQLDDPSYHAFQQAAADRMNAFLEQNLATINHLRVGQMVAEHDGLLLEGGDFEYHIRLFMGAHRTKGTIDTCCYAVHPEEMDLLMRVAYGSAYEAHFGHMDA